MSEVLADHVEDALFTGPESVSIRERLVVSPASGRFVPLPPETFTTEGEWVRRGQTIAHIRAGNEHVEVRSAFSGWMMGMLAIAGQPVHANDALFWIRGS
jgi:biotin carboxyl carrier protein